MNREQTGVFGILARRRGGDKKVLDLHKALMQSRDMARCALGSRIAFTLDFMPGSAHIGGSPGPLQNAFINLFFNVRDAMPQGGEIRVKTSLLPGRVSPVTGMPGYLVVSVAGERTGTAGPDRERIFEPLSTAMGKRLNGTGLPKVEATVKSHGGWITADSAPGYGSGFRIHLPLMDGFLK